MSTMRRTFLRRRFRGAGRPLGPGCPPFVLCGGAGRPLPGDALFTCTLAGDNGLPGILFLLPVPVVLEGFLWVLCPVGLFGERLRRGRCPPPGGGRLGPGIVPQVLLDLLAGFLLPVLFLGGFRPAGVVPVVQPVSGVLPKGLAVILWHGVLLFIDPGIDPSLGLPVGLFLFALAGADFLFSLHSLFLGKGSISHRVFLLSSSRMPRVSGWTGTPLSSRSSTLISSPRIMARSRSSQTRRRSSSTPSKSRVGSM